MSNVRRSLEQAKQQRARIPARLDGALGTAVRDLDRALQKLDDLVTGYWG